METNSEEKLYAINLDWFDRNKVSFSEVGEKRVCASCKKKSTPEKKKSPYQLIKLVSDCCAKEKDYIHSEQSIVESVFRLFLSSGNHPLKAEDILQNIDEKRFDNPLSMSVETLQKLLDGTRFLGLGPVGPGC